MLKTFSLAEQAFDAPHECDVFRPQRTIVQLYQLTKDLEDCCYEMCRHGTLFDVIFDAPRHQSSCRRSELVRSKS